MNCQNCQQPLREDALFCTGCGTPVRRPQHAPESDSVPTVVRPNYGATNTSADPDSGRVLDGKYELVERLGSGGMGAVWRARRIHIGDEVAVKVLHPRFVDDEAAIERFRREARAAAQLHHPNVVTIHDYGESQGGEGFAYIVMELVSGISLRDLLKREGRLPLARAVALMRDICAGVGAAHRRGIIHRDIKPDNIIVLAADADRERETVKVVDFGIAKLRDLADKMLTQTGVVVGTPHYMSPEQCRGASLDVRADVYSLAALLYEMLAGAPPFTAPTVTGVIAKHLTDAPPSLPANSGVPRSLEAVILRALSKDPAARQADATELSRDLQNAAQAADHPTAQQFAPATEATHVAHVVPTPAPQPQTHAPQYYTPQPQTGPQQFAPQQPYGGGPQPPRKKSRAPLILVLVLGFLFIGGLGLAGMLVWRGRSRGTSVDINVRTPTPRASSNSSANSNTASDVPVLSAAMQRAEQKILNGSALTRDDLAGLSASELRLLRNTVYARYGRAFNEPELRRYFQTRPWYQTRDNFSESQITDADRANTDLIKAFESGSLTPNEAATVRQEVNEAIDEWVDATRDHDLDEHMSYYAPTLETYYSKRGVSSSQVRSDRARAFSRYQRLDVEVDNVQIKPDPTGQRATVTFDKTWEFTDGDYRSSGSVKQQLILAKFGNRWLITGEKDLEVHYKNSEEQ